MEQPVEQQTLSSSRVYSGVEHGIISVPLDELFQGHDVTVFPEIEKRGLYVVRLEKNRLVFAATNHVGLIPINDRISIDVRPKLPVRNFTRLLTISGIAPVTFERLTRTYARTDESIPLLLDLFTHSLVSSLGAVAHHGLLREYAEEHSETSLPHGRLMMGATFQRFAARNVNHRAVVSWFKHTADNGPNRLLKYAVWHLSRYYQALTRSQAGATKMFHRLTEAYALFESVTLDLRQTFFQHPVVRDLRLLPAIREYYRTPINLAVAILTEKSVSLDCSDDLSLALPSLLLNLEDVFEAYVRNVLRSAFLGSSLSVSDGNANGLGGAKKLLFDDAPSEDATPDIVIHPSAADFLPASVVIEIKYKRFDNWPGRDDLNQLIAYSASYRCRHNVLLHPVSEPGRAGLRKLGVIGDAHFYVYGIDLAANAPEVEENLLIDRIRRLAGAL